jgi:hypothetical protein
MQGRCIQHPTAAYERTGLHTVDVAAAETISTPSRISGISSRNYSQTEYYIESRATSSFGHDVEIRYDFGDGTISDWYPQFTWVFHTWNLGTYDVTSQARCADHPEIVSEWGPVYVCEFRELLQGIGDQVIGPTTGNVGVPVEFSVAEVTSNEGHDVEYMYFYRRANTTELVWREYGPSVTQTITWDQAGTYYVRARARCVLHPDVINQTRDQVTIVISP